MTTESEWTQNRSSLLEVEKFTNNNMSNIDYRFNKINLKYCNIFLNSENCNSTALLNSNTYWKLIWFKQHEISVLMNQPKATNYWYKSETQ